MDATCGDRGAGRSLLFCQQARGGARGAGVFGEGLSLLYFNLSCQPRRRGVPRATHRTCGGGGLREKAREGNARKRRRNFCRGIFRRRTSCCRPRGGMAERCRNNGQRPRLQINRHRALLPRNFFQGGARRLVRQPVAGLYAGSARRGAEKTRFESFRFGKNAARVFMVDGGGYLRAFGKRVAVRAGTCQAENSLRVARIPRM